MYLIHFKIAIKQCTSHVHSATKSILHQSNYILLVLQLTNLDITTQHIIIDKFISYLFQGIDLYTVWHENVVIGLGTYFLTRVFSKVIEFVIDKSDYNKSLLLNLCFDIEKLIESNVFKSNGSIKGK